MGIMNYRYFTLKSTIIYFFAMMSASAPALATSLSEVNQGLEEFYKLANEINRLSPPPAKSENINPLDARDAQFKRGVEQRERELGPAILDLEAKASAQLLASRSGYLLTYAENWAKLAADLDAESYNILVLALIENYHQQPIHIRPSTGVLLQSLSEATRPQLAKQAELDNSLLTLDYGAEYSLFYALTLQTARAVWNHTGRPNPWRDLWQKRAEAAARNRPPPAGLLTYRSQPLPKVAGLLEYKQTYWQSLASNATKALRRLRPGPVVVQAFASVALGFSTAWLETTVKRAQTQKFDAGLMLKLHQVHVACELANLVVEVQRACVSEKQCENPQAKQATLSRLFVESLALANENESLQHLYTEDATTVMKKLSSRVPLDKRPLFSELLKTNSADGRQARCQEVALGLTASEAKDTSELIDDYFAKPSPK